MNVNKRKIRKDSCSEEEKILLREIFENNSKKFIIEEFKKAKFGRSTQSIFRFARQLGLKRNSEIVKQDMIEGGKNAPCPPNKMPWTTEEDGILKKFYSTSLQNEIEDKLPERTFKAIRGRAVSFGLSRDKKFIDMDRALHLKRNLGVDSTWQLEKVKDKSRQTNLERRGVEYPTQSSNVQRKVKQTVQKRYGVDNVFQAEEIKNKSKETNLKNLGVENPQQNPDIKKKTGKTCQEKYGVVNPFQLVDRVQAGMMEKHGVKSPLQDPEIKAKQQATNVERYGTSVPAQNSNILNKIEKTNLIRYGSVSPFGNKGVQQKIIKTNLSKFGFANPMKSSEVQNKVRESLYKHGTHKCSKQQYYLSNLLKGELNYSIENCNVDILFENKIICEYDGGGHTLSIKIGVTSQEEFYEIEKKRDLFLKSKGYSIIRIISKKDLLPKDEIILKMISEAIAYLSSGHSWIHYDIDNSFVFCSSFQKKYNYGILQKIT